MVMGNCKRCLQAAQLAERLVVMPAILQLINLPCEIPDGVNQMARGAHSLHLICSQAEILQDVDSEQDPQLKVTWSTSGSHWRICIKCWFCLSLGLVFAENTPPCRQYMFL